MAAKKDHTPHLRVRIEPALLARLEKSRAQSGRTLTGEIVQRLEHSFHRDDMHELVEQMGKSFREAVAADILSPDVVRWAAEKHRADELEKLAEKTKNKEEKSRLRTEALTIRATIERLMVDDAASAAERWRVKLKSRKTEKE